MATLEQVRQAFSGSYAVERMTDELEAAALDLMRRVEDQGGAVAAIGAGFQKGEIERNAYRIAQETDSGERVVVGVNRFALERGWDGVGPGLRRDAAGASVARAPLRR